MERDESESRGAGIGREEFWSSYGGRSKALEFGVVLVGGRSGSSKVTLLTRMLELAPLALLLPSFFLLVENELRLEVFSAEGMGIVVLEADCFSEDFCRHRRIVPDRFGGVGLPKSRVGAVVIIAGVTGVSLVIGNGGVVSARALLPTAESEACLNRNMLKRGLDFETNPDGMFGTGSGTNGEAGRRFICSLERACAVFLVTSRLRRSRRSVSLRLP